MKETQKKECLADEISLLVLASSNENAGTDHELALRLAKPIDPHVENQGKDGKSESDQPDGRDKERNETVEVGNLVRDGVDVALHPLTGAGVVSASLVEHAPHAVSLADACTAKRLLKRARRNFMETAAGPEPSAENAARR